jgi:hypothetical protein
VPLPLQQPPQEPEGGLPIAPRLDQEIEHLAFVVDRAPEIMDPAPDADKDLVEMPARGARASLPDPHGIDAPEFEHPLADGFVGHVDTPLGEQVLDVALAEREPETEPDRVLDDVGRKAVPGIGRFAHPARYPVDGTIATRFPG